MQTPTNPTVNVATSKRVSKLVTRAYQSLFKAETTMRLLSAGERGWRLDPADCAKLHPPQWADVDTLYGRLNGVGAGSTPAQPFALIL